MGLAQANQLQRWTPASGAAVHSPQSNGRVKNSGFAVGKLKDEAVPEGRGEVSWDLENRVVPEIGKVLGFNGVETRPGSD